MLRLMRHSAFAVGLACAAIVFSGPTTALWANPQCFSNNAYGSVGFARQAGWIDNWGTRHISYSYPSWWSQDIRDRIEDTIWQWNQRANGTGVIFDWVGSAGDVQFAEGGLSDPTVCGEMDWNSNVVRLHSTLISEAGNHPAAVNWVIGHEIGHGLGLDHDTDTSAVMYAPSGSAADCTSSNIGSWSGNVPTEDEGNMVGDCLDSLTDPNHQFPGDSEYYFDPGEEECWNVYVEWVEYSYDWFWDYWYVSDSGWYWFDFWCGDPNEYPYLL